MTEPTNHTVTILNRYGNNVAAPVVYVKDLGGGTAEVRVKSNYHIETGLDHPAIYATPRHEAKGMCRVAGKTFTEALTYIYHGTFART